MGERLSGAGGAAVPLVCPVCGSTEVQGDGPERPGDVVYEDMLCEDCGSSWVDIYELVERESVNRGTRADIAAARMSRRSGIFVDVDMAYEDRTDLGFVSDGWQS